MNTIKGKAKKLRQRGTTLLEAAIFLSVLTLVFAGILYFCVSLLLK